MSTIVSFYSVSLGTYVAGFNAQSCGVDMRRLAEIRSLLSTPDFGIGVLEASEEEPLDTQTKNNQIFVCSFLVFICSFDNFSSALYCR